MDSAEKDVLQCLKEMCEPNPFSMEEWAGRIVHVVKEGMVVSGMSGDVLHQGEKIYLAVKEATSSRWARTKDRKDGTAQVYSPSLGPLRQIVPVAETEERFADWIVWAFDHAPEMFAAIRGTVEAWRLVPPHDMVLHCPKCGKQHLDIGEFATRVHRKHLCENTTEGEKTGCGHLWVPFGYATRGVLMTAEEDRDRLRAYLRDTLPSVMRQLELVRDEMIGKELGEK